MLTTQQITKISQSKNNCLGFLLGSFSVSWFGQVGLLHLQTKLR